MQINGGIEITITTDKPVPDGHPMISLIESVRRNAHIFLETSNIVPERAPVANAGGGDIIVLHFVQTPQVQPATSIPPNLAKASIGRA